MFKWLKKLNPAYWGKQWAKGYLKAFVNEKWEKYEKEAVQYVRTHGPDKLKALSDKWQKEALEWIEKW